jgi:hypothetical protein
MNGYFWLQLCVPLAEQETKFHTHADNYSSLKYCQPLLMVSSQDFGTAHLKWKVVTRKFDQLVAQCFNIYRIHLLHVSAITSWWWNLCVLDCCAESVQRQIRKFIISKNYTNKQTNINFIFQGLELCLNRNKYFLLHLRDNTLPMLMGLDVRDFNVSWSPILRPFSF